MNNISCFDSNGNPLANFYQWDVNQELIIKGVDTSITEFHFCNRLSKMAQKVNGTVSDETIVVKIPNILLQQAETIVMYAYRNTEDKARTLHTIRIPVHPRPRPDGYYYEDNIEYIHWEELAEEAKDLLAEMRQCIEEAESIVDEWKEVEPDYIYIADMFYSKEDFLSYQFEKGKTYRFMLNCTNGLEDFIPGEYIGYAQGEGVLHFSYIHQTTKRYMLSGIGENRDIKTYYSTDQIYSPDSENAQSGKAIDEVISFINAGRFSSLNDLISYDFKFNKTYYFGTNCTINDVIPLGEYVGRYYFDIVKDYAILEFIAFIPDGKKYNVIIKDEECSVTVEESRHPVTDIGTLVDFSQFKTLSLEPNSVYTFDTQAIIASLIGYGSYIGCYYEVYDDSGSSTERCLRAINLINGEHWHISINAETATKISQKVTVIQEYLSNVTLEEVLPMFDEDRFANDNVRAFIRIGLDIHMLFENYYVSSPNSSRKEIHQTLKLYKYPEARLEAHKERIYDNHEGKWGEWVDIKNPTFATIDLRHHSGIGIDFDLRSYVNHIGTVYSSDDYEFWFESYNVDGNGPIVVDDVKAHIVQYKTYFNGPDAGKKFRRLYAPQPNPEDGVIWTDWEVYDEHGEKDFVNAGVFNSIDRLRVYKFTENKMYMFVLSGEAAANITEEQGAYIGRYYEHKEYIPEEDVYNVVGRYLEFTKTIQGGVVYTYNLDTFELDKENVKESVVDNSIVYIPDVFETLDNLCEYSFEEGKLYFFFVGRTITTTSGIDIYFGRYFGYYYSQDNSIELFNLTNPTSYVVDLDRKFAYSPLYDGVQIESELRTKLTVKHLTSAEYADNGDETLKQLIDCIGFVYDGDDYAYRYESYSTGGCGPTLLLPDGKTDHAKVIQYKTYFNGPNANKKYTRIGGIYSVGTGEFSDLFDTGELIEVTETKAVWTDWELYIEPTYVTKEYVDNLFNSLVNGNEVAY